MSGFFEQVRPVFHKEWLDAIRDRRSLASALFLPLMMPLIINLMFGTLAGTERRAEDMLFHVQGAEYAPGLMEWIERAGHEVVAAEGDLFEAVRAGDLELAILIDADYAEDFAKGIPASVSLIVDGSKTDLLPLSLRARSIIAGYGAHTSALRLIARGVSGDVRTPVLLEELDVATAEQRSVMFLSFIPLMIILAAFAYGMNVAIDTTAGERERGSLEALLINPVSTEVIVVGKWLVTVAFANAGVVLVLAATLFSLQQTSLEDLGIRMDVGALDVVMILVGVIPLTFLSSGVQLLMSSFARSYKEAQLYVSLLMVLPSVPFVITMLSGMPTSPWLATVPVLGQQMIVTQILGGEIPGLPLFLVAGVSAILLGLLCVVATARLFRHERIVFGANS